MPKEVQDALWRSNEGFTSREIAAVASIHKRWGRFLWAFHDQGRGTETHTRVSESYSPASPAGQFTLTSAVITLLIVSYKF